MFTEDEKREIFLQRMARLLGLEGPGQCGKQGELEAAEETGDGLSEEALYEACRKLKKERDIYYLAMDNCTDSFHVTDEKGNILFINKTFERRSKFIRSDIIGKNVTDMEHTGIYRPSAVRIALKEHRQLTMVQSGPGGDAIVTATPIEDEEDNLVLCVSNARFVDELTLLDKYYSHKAQANKGDYKEKRMVSKDEAMVKLYEVAKQIAGADSSILITGETGTGKSMIARYIHENSSRSKKKFIELNCAAIPENLMESELFGYESGAFTGAKKGGKPGLFELAEGGTLFLDEIGDMPLPLQAKLLHAIQNRTITRIGGTSEKSINVRIITATNKNLEKLVEEGQFRSDLYYRINVVPLHMPALRQRKKDIKELGQFFLRFFNERYSRETAITDEALEMLCHYRWPGNIRELENMMERLVVTNRTGVIAEEDLPGSVRVMNDVMREDIIINRMVPLKEALERVEQKLVEMAFEENGSTYKAAQALGISQSGASRKFLKYMKKESPQELHKE
ncbi:MAG: sigma 54-interacting transcriptional regulator [Firmicutes bacterium]|nr:sigma 54-interacting transcriptional regulator [Bacillota bacterium]